MVQPSEGYANYCDYGFEFNISPYDNSLSFANHAPADLELVWMDCSFHVNLSFIEKTEFFKSRISALRSFSTVSISVCIASPADFSFDAAASIPDVFIVNLIDELGPNILDETYAEITGSKIHPSYYFELAKQVSCKWVPGALSDKKAIFIDLDNTSHSGVLAEDGITNVDVADDMRKLNRYLKKMKNGGMNLE